MGDNTQPDKEKKSIKTYITTLSRKASKKAASGAQQLGTLARSATISRSKSKASKKNKTTTPTGSVTSSFFYHDLSAAPGETLAPRLPNVVYRSPDADFIESHMEARIRSIGSDDSETEGEEEVKQKKKKDRMGGYTIRIIEPSSANEA
ncbi:hypothetical protein TWF718_005347 [Orbilia javanica]|uniref:Uncharacterized protein n=1 Tax=Orbilia javanica TaxID=47235 RepID=A0AAN8N1A1_9PEZI